jgi:hypothetical protein
MILKVLGAPKGIYQFLGYWFLLCYFLHAFFSYKLVCIFTENYLRQLIGTSFLTFSPILLYRSNHIALCSHWFILCCILISLTKIRSQIKRTVLWSFLCFLALGIHPYFILFALTFSFFDFLRSLWFGIEKGKILKGLLSFSLVLLISLLTMKLLNLLDSSIRCKTNENLKFYVTDLFMFFNSGNKSLFLPSLWIFKIGQYEGFSYFGLGIIILCCVSIKDSWGHIRKSFYELFKNPKTGPTLFAASLLAFFSLGARIRIFGHGAIDISFIYKPFLPFLGSFRSNGRFIWALYYFIILLLVTRKEKSQFLKSYSMYLLTFLFVLQLFDLSPLRSTTHKKQQQNYSSYLGSLKLSDLKFIKMIPPQINPKINTSGFSRLLFPLSVLAAQNNLSINSGMRAHLDTSKSINISKDLREKMKKQIFEKKTAYIIDKTVAETFSQDFLGEFCQKMIDYYVCHRF